MSVPKDILRENPCISEWAILHAYRGSIAHGMYVPNTDPLSIDDKDTMAICVPSKEYYLGLKDFGSRSTLEIKEREWDIVVYESRKAFDLLSKGNPNILSLLWVNDEHIIKQVGAGKLLRQNRHLFVGKHVYASFIGYATSQMHRMEQYSTQGYMGDKRKQLVDRFGYDTKNAAHLIRLLRMGIEFLVEGELRVFRHDASQLLDIKRGQWTLDQVKAEASRLFERAEEAYIRSTLPPSIDRDAISQLAAEVVEAAWSERA